MKEIIEKARELALEEIEKNGVPHLELWEFSNQKGQELANKLKADKNIVMIGTVLMDIRLGRAKKENQLQKHTSMGAEATKEFLNNFNLDEETKNKIINCVEAHHGTKEYICKEAEICANADCYRFIHPKGVFNYLMNKGKAAKEFNKALEEIKYKLEEKHNILSLDICKKELEPYYKMFKELIKKAREWLLVNGLWALGSYFRSSFPEGSVGVHVRHRAFHLVKNRTITYKTLLFY